MATPKIVKYTIPTQDPGMGEYRFWMRIPESFAGQTCRVTVEPIGGRIPIELVDKLNRQEGERADAERELAEYLEDN